MSTPRLVALVALLLLAPVALAQAPPVPAGAYPVGEPTILYSWVGTRDQAELELNGTQGTLWFALEAPNATSNATSRTYLLNFTNEDLALANRTLVLEAAKANDAGWAIHSLPFTTGKSGDNAYWSFDYAVYETVDGNATLLRQGAASLSVYVVAPDAPVAPNYLLIGGGLALLGVLAAGGLAYRRSAERRRMNAAPRRSQVMREMELEKQLERAAEKDPEQAAVIKAEIREQEQVRETRREMQILLAKRADALKTLDLLRKRHEAGGLTKLQYDNMAAKKQADLAKIDAEIAAMEREGAGSAA